MKKLTAVLAAIACLGIQSAAFADSGNIIDDVVSGAEDVVDGVVSGAEEILTPGETDSVPDSSDNQSSGISEGVSSVPDRLTAPDSGTNENVNTGVPLTELAALGVAALGGLGTMAVTAKRRK